MLGSYSEKPKTTLKELVESLGEMSYGSKKKMRTEETARRIEKYPSLVPPSASLRNWDSPIQFPVSH